MYASIQPAKRRKKAGKSARRRGDRTMKRTPSRAMPSSDPPAGRGRNGRPKKLEKDVIAPTQKGTSRSAMPRRGRYIGVNAETCPYAATSQKQATLKSRAIRAQPEGGRLSRLRARPSVGEPPRRKK